MVSLITRLDTGHRDMIHDAQTDFYGTKLATCSSDRSVKIFDVKPDGQQVFVAELLGHEGPVWQLSWSHPMHGNLLCSCSYDKKVIIWKESAGKWSKHYEYSNHDASINSVCWAPAEYGLMLACASSDSSISIVFWTGDSWESKKIINAHTTGSNAVSWCPAVVAGSLSDPGKQSQPGQSVKRIVSGGCDSLVKIWKENPEGQWIEEKRLDGHKDWVRDVAWAPCIGLPGNTIASCSQDQRVIIWRCLDLEAGDWSKEILHTFDDAVWHVSWSLCGTMLAVSCGDNKISLWKETLEGEWVRLTDSPKNSMNTTSMGTGNDSEYARG